MGGYIVALDILSIYILLAASLESSRFIDVVVSLTANTNIETAKFAFYWRIKKSKRGF
jgi:hypothetical protein